MTTHWGTVISKGLNLRNVGSMDGVIVDQLQAGDRLKILARDAGWLYVRVKQTKTGIGVGQRGWVHSKHVALDAITPPDVPPIDPPAPPEPEFPRGDPPPIIKPDPQAGLWWVLVALAAGVVALVSWLVTP